MGGIFSTAQTRREVIAMEYLKIVALWTVIPYSSSGGLSVANLVGLDQVKGRREGVRAYLKKCWSLGGIGVKS